MIYIFDVIVNIIMWRPFLHVLRRVLDYLVTPCFILYCRVMTVNFLNFSYLTVVAALKMYNTLLLIIEHISISHSPVVKLRLQPYIYWVWPLSSIQWNPMLHLKANNRGRMWLCMYLYLFYGLFSFYVSFISCKGKTWCLYELTWPIKMSQHIIVTTVELRF